MLGEGWACDTHAPAGAFFPGGELEDRCSTGAPCDWSRGFLGAVRDRLDLPGCRADALVGKAQELLREQYAATGAAALMSLDSAVGGLESATGSEEVARTLASLRNARNACSVHSAYRRYCWPVAGVDDLRFAPFHLLATERRVHTDQTHRWHMETFGGALPAGPGAPRRHALPHRESHGRRQSGRGDVLVVELTAAGGEGMVVKPMQWLVRGKRGLAQPAIKCRGPEIFGSSMVQSTTHPSTSSVFVREVYR